MAPSVSSLPVPISVLMPSIGGLDGRAQGGAEGTGNLIARRESLDILKDLELFGSSSTAGTWTTNGHNTAVSMHNVDVSQHRLMISMVNMVTFPWSQPYIGSVVMTNDAFTHLTPSNLQVMQTW
ncbi:hypothetical protein BKA82DRAFT_4013712 [Pisolithus tinctorius]|nr:hypothetical protein BKA82DRAFT_4013712 [Pisolithus tinctorius]